MGLWSPEIITLCLKGGKEKDLGQKKELLLVGACKAVRQWVQAPAGG